MRFDALARHATNLDSIPSHQTKFKSAASRVAIGLARPIRPTRVSSTLYYDYYIPHYTREHADAVCFSQNLLVCVVPYTLKGSVSVLFWNQRSHIIIIITIKGLLVWFLAFKVQAQMTMISAEKKRFWPLDGCCHCFVLQLVFPSSISYWVLGFYLFVFIYLLCIFEDTTFIIVALYEGL